MIETDLIKILEENIYMSLASVDQDSTPLATPVFFVFDRENIYWFSTKNTHHSRNISMNPKVAAVVFDSSADEGTGVGAYFQGNARALEASEIDDIIVLFNQRANVFKLNKSMFTPTSEAALFKLEISAQWTNDTSGRIAQYVDEKQRGENEA